MIEVRNVSKSFPARGKAAPVTALQDLSLTIQDNEFITLLGPSGCGKTTLLRHIAGLIPISEGEILVDGKPVTGPSPDRAVVFQSFALLPWASVRANIAIGLEIRGDSRAQVTQRVDEVLEKVGLTEFAERYPGELSGGMQQRVGLARALAVDPKVLLMDEPFGALDEQTRRLLQEELLLMWEESPKTVVFVTHSMEEAVLLGDRVVLMSPRPGRIDEIVDVPLSRPRSDYISDVEASPEFRDITAHLWSRLREMQPPQGKGSMAS
jgi:ABC-type nitrate/sulfonate/bicarbonate transport system ATPase subunit